jgi:nucleoredoxin
MTRSLIFLVAVLVIGSGLYFAWGTGETFFALVGTAWDLSPAGANEVSTNNAAAASDASPAPAPAGFAVKFHNSLMTLQDGVPKALDTSTLSGVKYWAFYYSASWCPPCRVFTPELVAFYNHFKPQHPDFELILVDEDSDESDMLAYMRAAGMPWPAIRYADIDNPALEAQKYCGEGIPCLVLVDAAGDVLASNESGGNYVDPHKILDEIQAKVK